jgi:hypothetical protein
MIGSATKYGSIRENRRSKGHPCYNKKRTGVERTRSSATFSPAVTARLGLLAYGGG